MTDDLLRIALADAVIEAAKRLHLPADLSADVDAIKANQRDPREPGRRQKMKDEKKLQRLIKRVFDRQSEKVRSFLASRYPGRTMKSDPIPDMEWSEEEESALVDLLFQASIEGIRLFHGMTNVKLDLYLTNKKAAEWAKQYSAKTIKGLNETTRQAIQSAVSDFISTSDMTIGDVMARLPFDTERAQTIAVTEITRSYAEANHIGAAELAKEFPDVQVTKTWFTNNDDRVCEICGPLNGSEVPYDEGWGENGDHDPEGIMQPPAHPNCRCWTDYTTNL